MKWLNKNNGNNGPKIKRVFTCEKCKFLCEATVFSKYNPYKCFHNDIIKDQASYNLMNGDIGSDKIAPEFCPYLAKKTRLEKLKRIEKIKIKNESR